MEFKIKTLIDEGKSQRQISIELKIPQTTLRRLLNKFNLKTNTGKKNPVINGKKICSRCKEIKEINQFHKRADNKKKHVSHCKKCATIYYGDRIKNVKIRMINYKGGKCERCKLKLEDTHYSVFDFHHINPKEKDIKFDRIKYQKWEVIQNEIDKCQLLCANCHRITHAELGGNN